MRSIPLNSRLMVAVVALVAIAFPSCSKTSTRFEPYTTKALQSARSLSKPVVVHVSAGWCPACRSLEAGALADSKVADALSSFARLEIDCTDRKNFKTQELLRDLQVEAIPLLLFKDGQGNEIKRLVGDQTPEAILAAIKQTSAS